MNLTITLHWVYWSEKGSLPVTYDVGGLRGGTSQVGGAFSHPQSSLSNQPDGGSSPTGDSRYSGASNAHTRTSATEQCTITSCTHHSWGLACQDHISEAWCGLVARAVDDVVGDDIG